MLNHGSVTQAPWLRIPTAVRWILLATLLAFLPQAHATLAQGNTPLAFQDTAPLTVTWPDPVQITLLNNTTETLAVTVQMSALVDLDTDTMLHPDAVLAPMPTSLTLPPAGQTTLDMPVADASRPAPGTYSSSLVFSVPNKNAVLRKPLTFIVPFPEAEAESVPVVLTPAVETWTLSAIRILPFLDPVCMRGLLVGCSIPVVDAPSAAAVMPATLGYLVNERGGGLAVELTGTGDRNNAELTFAFDGGWGLTGTYTGRLALASLSDLPPDGSVPEAVDSVMMTVHVKDIIIWPLFTLALGIAAAREVQRYLTVHRDVLQLLRRLNAAGSHFAELRKSIHGYTVAEDFQARRQELEERIQAWDRNHYGEPTAEEKAAFRQDVVEPLAALEAQIALWGRFRDKLERLRHRLEIEAKPAVEQAEPPKGVDLSEPCFYTNARRLLQGSKLTLAQVPEMAARIDQAAEIAGAWGEMHHLAILVRDALRQLYGPNVELSESEHAMLETARHQLNSAARDLWEARDLAELRTREAHAELAEAQELTRRLLDPFVYYAGSELALETSAGHDAGTALVPKGDGTQRESLPVPGDGTPRSLERSYARLDSYHIPHLDYDTYHALPTDATRVDYVERTLLLGERTVTWIALTTALIAGLDRYFMTNFGALADYLALATWALGAKVGLELVNLALSRLLPQLRS